MASFDYPPLTPDPDPAPLSPTIPLNPPMVGEASPFDHVDGQNRDLILESIRSWVRHQLRAWTTAWQEYLVYWLQLVEDWLNGFITAADAYITEHAIAGYSFRVTATAIAATGTTDVTITTGLDAEHRPLVVGDLVVDSTVDGRFGAITVVIDGTHATVQPLGTLKGYAGFGWWTTSTTIAHSGTTAVVIPTNPTRGPQLDDLVVDASDSHAYGTISAITDATNVVVTYLGTLQGPQGIQGIPGPDGPQGDPGVVQAVVAGTNITVDATDPANPVVSSTGGSGVVETIVPGKGFTVDATDPANPILNVTSTTGFPIPFHAALPSSPAAGDVIYYFPLTQFLWFNGSAWKRFGTIQGVVAGAHVTVDNTDPLNPVVAVVDGDFAGWPIDPNLEITNLIDRYGVGVVGGTPGIDYYGVHVYDNHTDVYGEVVNVGAPIVRIGSDHSVAVAGGIEVNADLNGIVMVFNDGSGATLRAKIVIDQKGMRMVTGDGQTGYFGLPPHAFETTTPLAGFMYWNNVSNTVRVFDGTNWFDLNMTIV